MDSKDGDTYKGNLLSLKKKSNFAICSNLQKDLESIMQSEVSQTEKDK